MAQTTPEALHDRAVSLLALAIREGIHSDEHLWYATRQTNTTTRIHP
ncbi:MAG: hypothetical protein MSC30_12730 [Gaiellaceae bacterium MAG52_C11]|nr:hypothetical protein [Candidatus Gaiellasilicea maunaloa]